MIMVKRFLLASLSIVLVSIGILLVDGLIAESTGLSLPGEISAALAFFVAFFVGGRIGGPAYFRFGVFLFFVVWVFSTFVIFDAVRDIQFGGESAPQVTWMSIAIGSWRSGLLSLAVSIMGLTIGARLTSADERSMRDTT